MEWKDRMRVHCAAACYVDVGAHIMMEAISHDT